MGDWQLVQGVSDAKQQLRMPPLSGESQITQNHRLRLASVEALGDAHLRRTRGVGKGLVTIPAVLPRFTIRHASAPPMTAHPHQYHAALTLLVSIHTHCFSPG